MSNLVFKAPDLKRAFKAAKAAGIAVNGVTIKPDGTIQVAELDQPMPKIDPNEDYEAFLRQCGT